MWSGFRSEDMSYVQVLLPSAVAEDFVDNVGREACLEFTDLNVDFQPYQRPYTKDIMRIQEVERRIREIEAQLREYKIPFESEVLAEDIKTRPRGTTIDTVAKDVNKAYSELKNQGSAEKDLHKQLLEREAKIEVLSQMDTFLSERIELVEERLGLVDEKEDAMPLIPRDERRPDDINFKYIAGVVTNAQRVSFERQVYLTTRGNSLVQFEATSNERMVFAVFFLGNQFQRLLRRLCQFMNIFVCYESDSEVPREQLLQLAKSERAEDKRAHLATKKLLLRIMRETATQLQAWKVTLFQEKGIRMTLNKFRQKTRNNVVLAEGWCATKSKEAINDIMERIVRGKGVSQPILTDCPFKGTPPTYFEENEFTAAFQAIVDTYGVPRYKEFNPAIPTIITFPFLFGVMYGDIFHGSCLLLFAISLFVADWFSDIRKSETMSSLFFARYVLLFMGAFAVYCGLIYNDCMSIMINGWNGSQWQHGYTDDGYAVMVQRDVYAVGVDPAWSGVDNQLSFENSLKMKLSVIIGVTQMTFGLFLKLSNHLQEKDMISVLFEFVPQMVFMLCFFGYMVFLIFYKWCIDWTSSTLPDTPSLITVLIKMFLSPGTVDTEVQIFPNKNFQAVLQVVFLLSLVLSIPVMLCVKPCILKNRMAHEHSYESVPEEEREETEVQMPVVETKQGESKSQTKGEETETKDAEHEGSKDKESESHEHSSQHGHGESFGDIMIHQLIHTIEYVLGTISNTASYLRLWALSLAHAELSEVFFDKTLRMTLESTGGGAVIMNVVSAGAFLMFTCGVLLVMDVLECFLHALRLHWVEFQNKFYYADGRPFQPFSFAKILDMD